MINIGEGGNKQLLPNAELADISTGGMGILSLSPVDVGEIIMVRLGARDLMMQVVRCVPEKGRWKVGCKFEQPLSNEEFQSITGEPPDSY